MSLLGEALEGGRVRLEAASGEGEYAVLRAVGGERVGRVVLEEEGDSLVVRELVIDAGHRGFGAGSGAAALVREAAEGDGRWRVLRACAPAEAGLAVYFWMRMGLRPVGGAATSGGLMFERILIGRAPLGGRTEGGS